MFAIPFGAYRSDHLRRCKAQTRFLSLELLLGPLDELDLRGIHWAIAGGESGPGARPIHRDWVRSIRDQCINFNVPFHFKQWGGTNKKRTGQDARRPDVGWLAAHDEEVNEGALEASRRSPTRVDMGSKGVAGDTAPE